MTLYDDLRDEARRAPESGIVTVANYGWGREGLIPLWAGEGDLPTPDFIAGPAARALENGETFYTHQRGIPELRAALARYHTRVFGKESSPDEYLVTGGGMQAIQMCLQATAGAGDEVIYFSPAWPNILGATVVDGATPVAVDLEFGDNGWALDLDRLEAAITNRTRVIFVNSPSNPTGWTADTETLQRILDMARKNGLWIIADEIYTRFFYGGKRSPSFLDIMEPEDRIVFVNTFSKNWAMTGWRIGWIKAHPSLAQMFENLIQYSTSGVAQFMQRGAVAALDEGDEFVNMQVARAHTARDILCSALESTGRARISAPEGAFYLFFAVDGVTDSLAASFEIVDRARVGLAPGSAFGEGADAYFRLCFNRRLDHIEQAAERLADWISAR
ncbi:MAG: pyridoxal phosphate-dependent aminotransferase [Rhizobiaceae bacterium]